MEKTVLGILMYRNIKPLPLQSAYDGICIFLVRNSHNLYHRRLG